MSWRTVIINKHCKLSYKNGYMIVRTDKLEMIHLSEINYIIIENGMASITSFLISELVKEKIKVIFCDEQRNPCAEIMPYYGAFNTSKKILNQTKWEDEKKDLAFQKIVEYKIVNQSQVLKNNNKENWDKLLDFANEVQPGDATNREGHAAKVYFNSLFGNDFTRDNDELEINKALNYGYSILLSLLNKEIVSKGYITQLGINHKNEYNNFNLACDLMEIFRPLVDEIVLNNIDKEFNKEYKYKLINLLNKQIRIQGSYQYLPNAVKIFIQNVFDYLENKKESIINYEL